MPELYYFRAFAEGKHSDRVHRRSSMIQFNRDFSEFYPIPMTGFSPQGFHGMTIVGNQPSFWGATTPRPQRMPQQGSSDPDLRPPQQQWHGVRGIQSYLTNKEDPSMHFRLHTPAPLLTVGSNSHGLFSTQGSVSPALQHPLPLSERDAVGQFEHQKTPQVDQMYGWNYHSDSGSSGYEQFFFRPPLLFSTVSKQVFHRRIKGLFPNSIR